jgi:hypothetical protein
VKVKPRTCFGLQPSGADINDPSVTTGAEPCVDPRSRVRDLSVSDMNDHSILVATQRHAKIMTPTAARVTNVTPEPVLFVNVPRAGAPLLGVAYTKNNHAREDKHGCRVLDRAYAFPALAGIRTEVRPNHGSDEDRRRYTGDDFQHAVPDHGDNATRWRLTPHVGQRSAMSPDPSFGR